MTLGFISKILRFNSLEFKSEQILSNLHIIEVVK